MARWYWSRKATAEESCRLKMSYLRKRGLLSGQATGEIAWTSSATGKTTVAFLAVDVIDDPHIRIAYALTDRKGNKADFDCKASLLTTDCNFGGVRYWFDCPYCGARVGALYLAPGDVYFRCRHCNNLSYHSRNESSPYGILGQISREIDNLRGQIKRWTWRGRPTRKVRKLHALEQKIGIVSSQVRVCLDKLKARLGDT